MTQQYLDRGPARRPLCATLLTLLTAFVLGCTAIPSTQAAELAPFSSDGCSLFPDGTLTERNKWCDCCLTHDIAYWQGGSAAEREQADTALRDCVREKTGDAQLAETMYLGVRAGGHPNFPTWYRWGYGWPYGTGYQTLSDADRELVQQRLDEYTEARPAGYCGAEKPTAYAEPRPATWATAVPAKELKNFYRLDAKVYRSAQPSKEGFQELASLGIRNILNLREYHSDSDGEDFGLTLCRVKMAAGSITTEQVITALRFIRDTEGPVLIHCWHGSDRTGTVSAMYRIVFQGWSKEAAIDELQRGGYGYHTLYKNIPEFIRLADIAAIKKSLGMTTDVQSR